MTGRPELWGSFGMVSSTHFLASAVGMSVLEAGGNAVDAAVAAGFALQVAEPHLNGPGGDMSLLFAGPDGVPTVLCGQGPAPAGATADHYRDVGLDRVPGAGLLAAAIPGSTAAWLTLLRDHGTKTLADVLGPAIGLAEHGVPVLPGIARSITAVQNLFTSSWTGSAAVYLPAGRPPEAGATLTNPQLAATYRRLLDESRAPTREAQLDAALLAWSQGFVAEAIDGFARGAYTDSTGEPHAGVLTGADLAGWRPTYEEPATVEVGEWTVAKTGLWGQGPVLLQQLALLQDFGLVPGHGLPCLDPLADPDTLHVLLEVSKLAFADRDAWFGDPAAATLAELLDPGYLAQRQALVGERADLALRPGRPGGQEPRLPTFPDLALDAALSGDPSDAPTGDPTVARTGVAAERSAQRGDTCHVCVVDRWGNTVAATPSGGWLTSSPVIPALGFPLGTRLQMTTLEPGLPTSLTPGRRPRTTLSPSMALRGGRVEVAFGTPGGDQQDQWQLLFFLRHAVGGLDLQASIEAPNLHSTHFPSSFYPRDSHPGEVVLESRWSPEVRAALVGRGHRIVDSAAWSLGRVCAVSRRDGVLRAGADPRGTQAYAAGR